LWKFITRKPRDAFVEEILAAEDRCELAEECLSNTTLDNSTLLCYTELDHVFEMADAHREEEEVERVAADLALRAKVGAEYSGEEEVDPVVVQQIKRVKRDKLHSANPTLEVKASRMIATGKRAVYARRVLDTCRSKFGCPEVTKANHRAVWRYAEQIMKDHGLRPSHRIALLPYVVELTFVPTMEMVGGVNAKRTHDYFVGGGMTSQMSLMERWTQNMRRLFQLE